MNIEKVQVIVHENEERKLYIHDVGAVDEVVATVAVRAKIDGELYGEYIVFKKPTVTVPEVVETVNGLLQTVIVNLTKGE